MAVAVHAEEIIQPEIILPEQYFARSVDPAEQPARRLMLAVLEDAVLTLFKHAGNRHPRSRLLVGEVEQWLDAGNVNWLFSFENICAVLNFDAAALRERLRSAGHRPRRAKAGRVLSLTIGRRFAGERHRVAAPRSHRRRAGVKG